jgi:hypothetical protein
MGVVLQPEGMVNVDPILVEPAGPYEQRGNYPEANPNHFITCLIDHSMNCSSSRITVSVLISAAGGICTRISGS